MKRVVVWVLVGFGGLLVVGALVAAISIWRVKASLDERTPEAEAFANDFARCFYRAERACFEAMTSWDSTTIESGLTAGATLRERLGARGDAKPVDESWRMHKAARAESGVTATILVALSVAYERDSAAHESFELVDEGNGLRVRNFRVDSPLTLGAPSSSAEPKDPSPGTVGTTSPAP